jgi:hypothetical protein
MHAVSCEKCENDLNPTYLVKRNFSFETEGVAIIFNSDGKGYEESHMQCDGWKCVRVEAPITDYLREYCAKYGV